MLIYICKDENGNVLGLLECDIQEISKKEFVNGSVIYISPEGIDWWSSLSAN